jgi:hypothetical protein
MTFDDPWPSQTGHTGTYACNAGLPMSACRRADRQRGRSRIHHTSDGPEHPACSKRAHGLRWQKRWRRDGDAPQLVRHWLRMRRLVLVRGRRLGRRVRLDTACGRADMDAWSQRQRGQASIRVGKHHWRRAGASVSIRWDSTVHSARVAPIGGISWGLQLQPRFEDN